MGCLIDNHARSFEISGWLRQGMTETAINQQLRILDPEHKDFSSATVSRHRTDCLGMMKLQKGRPPRSTVTAADVKDVKIEDVNVDEVRNIALRTFYARIKLNPADVGMKELVSVIAALSKDKSKPSTKDAVEEAMSNLDDD